MTRGSRWLSSICGCEQRLEDFPESDDARGAARDSGQQKSYRVPSGGTEACASIEPVVIP